jgi:hypothetical protein
MPDIKPVEGQGGQPGSSGTPSPQGNEPAGQQPFDGRFKTSEDLFKSYRELEAKFTQTAQAKADAERKLQELSIRATASPPPDKASENGEDLNARFWENPVEVMRRVTQDTIAPLVDTQWEAQKDKLRSNPEFSNLEPQIEAIVNQYPNLKFQPGSAQQLFKMVKGLNYNEEEEYRKYKDRVLAEQNGKVAGAVEGGSAPPLPGQQQTVTLSDEEKMVARKFNPELSEAEAFVKYAEHKKKWGV